MKARVRERERDGGNGPSYEMSAVGGARMC